MAVQPVFHASRKIEPWAYCLYCQGMFLYVLAALWGMLSGLPSLMALGEVPFGILERKILEKVLVNGRA